MHAEEQAPLCKQTALPCLPGPGHRDSALRGLGIPTSSQAMAVQSVSQDNSAESGHCPSRSRMSPLHVTSLRLSCANKFLFTNGFCLLVVSGSGSWIELSYKENKQVSHRIRMALHFFRYFSILFSLRCWLVCVLTQD